jgi:hypothetical protein
MMMMVMVAMIIMMIMTAAMTMGGAETLNPVTKFPSAKTCHDDPLVS